MVNVCRLGTFVTQSAIVGLSSQVRFIFFSSSFVNHIGDFALHYMHLNQILCRFPSQHHSKNG